MNALATETLSLVLFWVTPKKAKCRSVCTRWRQILDSHRDRVYWRISPWLTELFNENNNPVHLPAFAWLVDTFSITANELLTHDMFDIACATDLKLAQWLFARYSLATSSQCRDIIGGAADVRSDQDTNDPAKYDPMVESIRGYRTACEHGQLAIAQWIVKDFDIGHDILGDHGNLLISKRPGCSRTINWLDDQTDKPPLVPLPFGDERMGLCLADWNNWACDAAGEVFAYECASGNIHAAKMIADEYELSMQEYSYALERACVRGRLAVAQWIHSASPFTLMAREEHIFTQICIRNHAKVAEWFVGAFKYTPVHLACVLAKTLAFGHIATAQWLVKRFEITRESIVGSDGAGCSTLDEFDKVFRVGHIEAAKWFIGTFKLCGSIMGGSNFLSSACAGGHLELARWLYSRAHWYRNFSQELRVACKAGHTRVAQWIAALPTKRDDVAYDAIDAFKDACEHNRLRTAEWMIDHFKLNAATGRMHDIYLWVVHAGVHGHLKMARLLANKFSLCCLGYQTEIFRGICAGSYLKCVIWAFHEFSITDAPACITPRDLWDHIPRIHHPLIISWLDAQSACWIVHTSMDCAVLESEYKIEFGTSMH